MAAVLGMARAAGWLPERCALVAVDSTGLEAGRVSHYYAKRSGKKRRQYPKLSLVCDTQTHLFTALVADRGPKPDHMEFRTLVAQAHAQQPFEQLVADAGYDAEHHHGFVHYKCDAHAVIRPRARPRHPKNPPRGELRRQMVEHFDKATYGQRWQIESAFSQSKRRQGSALRSRHLLAQAFECRLYVLTHNLMILLLPTAVFSTEQVRFAAMPDVASAESGRPMHPSIRSMYEPQRHRYWATCRQQRRQRRQRQGTTKTQRHEDTKGTTAVSPRMHADARRFRTANGAEAGLQCMIMNSE